jgi:hypothetical protein
MCISGGFVGIGTVTPTVALDVSGSIRSSKFLTSNGSATIPTYSFTSDPSTGVHLVGTSQLAFDTAGVQRMVISNGSVGIGTTPSSVYALDVSGSLRLVAANSAIVLDRGVVQASSTSTASTASFAFVNDLSSGVYQQATGNLGLTVGGVRTAFFTSNRVAFDTCGAERMCISGGFVGIGTTAPKVALEVVGDISATTYNGPGGTALAPHYTFSDDRTTGLFFPGANMIGMTAGGRERMRISNGFVAIGTTVDPSSALDISGTFRIIGRNGNITFSNGTIDVSGTPLVSTTGAFSNATSTSNVIGGVTLSNRDLSMTDTGRILGMLGVSNVIGGVTLSNTNIANSGFTQSSNFRGSNGSATIPAYSFTNDPSTGLHLAGGSQLAFDTSGVQRMVISNGNVGIGTAVPSYRLDLSTNGTLRSGELRLTSNGIGYGALKIQGSTANHTMLFQDVCTTTALVQGTGYDGWLLGTVGNAYGDNPSNLYFARTNSGTGADPAITIQQAGNVGIGTSNPRSLLDLGVEGSAIRIAGTNINTGLLLQGYSNAGSYIRSQAGNLFLGGNGAGSLVTMTSSAVGINVTAPTQTLDVSGGLRLVRPAASTTLNSIILSDSLGTGAGFRFGIGLQGATSTANAGCDLAIAGYDNANGQLPAANTPYVLVKRSNGFVGIGTSTPSYMLDISSGSNSQGIRITAGNAQINIQNPGFSPIQLYQSAVGQGLYTTNSLPVNFYQNGGLRMCMSNDKVGINTNDPQYMLDVNGSARITGGLIFSVQSI